MDSPSSRSRKRPAPSSPGRSTATAPPATLSPSCRNILLILAFSALVGAAQYYNRMFHVLLVPGAGGPAAVVASLLGSSGGGSATDKNAVPCEKQTSEAIMCNESDTKRPSSSESIAESIIQSSYDATYAKLAAMPCPKSQPAGNCYRTLLRRDFTATNESPLPWWFRTLLQESAVITSQWWMLLKSNDPPLRQCQLPKVGSKQWSMFIHILNGDPNPHKPDGKNRTNSWNERGRNDAGPKFVVLRDPLERYLSAFLDKCVNPKNAWQKHCEPWENGFSSDPGNKIMAELRGDHRVVFEAFVHASPLKWNMHFLPQALLCDGLYRTIHEYDYVARMGPSFYSDLQAMGQMFGKKADDAIQDIFDYKSKLREEKEENRGAGGVNQGSPQGIEMKASEKVLEYYTPELVRTVLEYTAIDYVLLNMTVPEWAEEMLRRANDRGG